MIENIGIGIDIVDIKKFKNISFQSHKSLYKKIFFISEINYCLNFNNPSEHFAGIFAAKEALIKSINYKLSIEKIEVKHHNKKPYFVLHSSKLKFLNFKLSISHDTNIAIACVVSFQRFHL